MKLKVITWGILACFLALSLDCGLFKNWRKGKKRPNGAFHQVEQIHTASARTLVRQDWKIV